MDPLLHHALAHSIAARLHRGLHGHVRHRFVHPYLQGNKRFWRVFFRAQGAWCRLGTFQREDMAALALAGAMTDPTLRDRATVRAWLRAPNNAGWIRAFAPQGKRLVARARWDQVARLVRARGVVVYWQERAVRRAYAPGSRGFAAEVAAWDALE